ncbi:MAG: radical SAM/SPASM domain-containing protein [Planctomycetota bacterium]
MYVEVRGESSRSATLPTPAPGDEEQRDVQRFLAHYEEHGRFPLFTQVQIETRTDCNRSCTFCPQSVQTRPLAVMERATFDAVIRQLVDVDFGGRLALFMTNEPLLDERLPALIAHARKASPRFFIDVNSNGNPLDLRQLDRLIAAGLDNINIEDYLPDRATQPERLSPNLAAIADAYAGNPKVTIHRRATDEKLSNCGGSVPVETTRADAQHSFCNFPFRNLSIAPSGDVVLCGMDYHYQNVFGNVRTQHLADIWHSTAMTTYRLPLLKRDRTGFCANCDVTQYPTV